MRFYSPHDATERILDSGRPLAPGEYFDLKKEEVEANKRLIEEGQILPVEPKKKDSDS